MFKRHERPVESYMKSALLISALALTASACTAERKAPVGVARAPTTAESQRATFRRIERIASLGNIGRRIDIFERVAGPPSDATARSAMYEVDGCPVSVDIVDGAVGGISISLTPTCKVDLKGVFDVSFVATHKLTYAEFEGVAGAADYTAPCLSSCGNAYDPFVQAVVTGPHANGYNDVVATTWIVDEPAIAAFNTWRNELVARTNEAYVFETKFNCDRSHNAVGRRVFANIAVEAIYFGPRENACTE
jgi:hypothetical protein